MPRYDEQTRHAIEESASHICEILNTSLSFLLKEPLTPEKLVYLLITTDADIPDGKMDETLGTVRGLMQRIYNLQQAIEGNPGNVWKRHWSRIGQNIIQIKDDAQKAN